jgi:hypothetical protein
MAEATQKSTARRTSDKTRKNGASSGAAHAASAGDGQPKTPSRKGAAPNQADQGSSKTSGKKRRKVNHGQYFNHPKPWLIQAACIYCRRSVSLFKHSPAR